MVEVGAAPADGEVLQSGGSGLENGGDSAIARVWPDYLSLAELDEAASLAGWPAEAGWWPEMRRIIVECECRSLWRFAHNGEDPNSGSYGLAQLNGTFWFEKAGEDFAARFDPVVNLRTALYVRTVRGRFGGAGGWSCADRLAIP
jgi:hypothetical protein